MLEHVFLVGLQVHGDTRPEAEKALMQHLPRPSGYPAPSPIECWWVAEDDRNDSSDNDSAVFVHPGAQPKAYDVLLAAGLTGLCNQPVREGGQFTGTYEPYEPHESEATRYERTLAARKVMNLLDVGTGDFDLLDALTWLVDNELMDEANIPAAFAALAGEKEYEWHGNQQDHWEQITERTQDAVEEAGLLTYTETEETT